MIHERSVSFTFREGNMSSAVPAFCAPVSLPRGRPPVGRTGAAARRRICVVSASSADSPTQAPNFTELASPEEFEAILTRSKEQGRPLVCAYHASWCSKCKQMYPRFKMVVPDFPKVNFCGINIQVVAGIPRRNNVTRIPHFQIFSNGELAFDVNGAGDKDQVLVRLRKLLTDETL
ncbi:Thioredoxin-like 3-1, chloroplastic [Porphyridium purpureum]|uniref:Thioredoxin-like 3-1, chloroplastic n=1 Tax=Porphyridium purpureum TaxID=35688 RepID=A0A5J4Z151_PORPP|nr:Thioredoxin-like 3-1, chloroplastic [Porphyridium purpureum]|eukprot:POR1094..scf208_2